MVGVDRWRRETKNQTYTTTKVINKGFSSKKAISLSVYIGRPSKWGNPFAMRKEIWRDKVCAEYEQHIATCLINETFTAEDFKEFDGKNLLCFCKPKRCHGDTLVYLYWMPHDKRLQWAKGILDGTISPLSRTVVDGECKSAE